MPGHVVAFQEPGEETVVRLPDPEWDRIQALEERVERLEKRLLPTDGQRRRPSEIRASEESEA